MYNRTRQHIFFFGRMNGTEIRYHVMGADAPTAQKIFFKMSKNSKLKFQIYFKTFYVSIKSYTEKIHFL